VLLRSAALGDGSVVHAAFSQRSDGDFREGDLRVPAVPIGVGPAVGHTWLRQQHGAAVVIVDEPGEHCGAEADAAVTICVDTPLTIRTADCAPIAIYSSNGVIGAVHAGWHGVVSGVIAACVSAMQALGAHDLRAIVGPCIHAECYEFGRDDLARVVGVVGDTAAGVTAVGGCAMDLPAAVVSALQRSGVPAIDVIDECTACQPQRFFSHRARAESERHVMVLWRSETDQ
jgi:hypothetical protein